METAATHLGQARRMDGAVEGEGSTDRTDGIYSIGAVARMVGVPAQTLRVWEDRYSAVVPVRSPGGQRLYSRDHVEQLRFIREQIESGLTAADAHRLLAAATRSARPAATHRRSRRRGRRRAAGGPRSGGS